MFEHSKLKDYASDFWDKKKSKWFYDYTNRDSFEMFMFSISNVL
jgi:hypothetical protein